MTNQVVGSAYVATKTPSEHDDWEIDWSARGLGTDTITASVWTVSAPDLVINTPAPSIGTPPTTTTVWLTGGTSGNYYLVTNEITTSGDRILDESFIVKCIPYRLIVT